MAEELYIDPNLPEWKKKHLREQERRRLAALQQEPAQQETGPTPEQVLAQRQAEEAEKARLAALQEEERKKRAAEEKERLKREAAARMAQFAGSATAVEREEVLKELVPSKSKPLGKAVSPRVAEPPAAAVGGSNSSQNLGNLPEWKRKQLEAEQERLRKLEEEKARKAAAIAEIASHQTG